MDQELKQKWVEALRSGEYKQGEGLLRTPDDCFCCLGVLCDVRGVKWVKEGHQYYLENGGSYYLPSWFLEEVGIEPGRDTELANMNDKGYAFPELADHIEQNL